MRTLVRIRRWFRVLWVAADRFNRNDGSPMAGYITGAELHVNGGMFMT